MRPGAHVPFVLAVLCLGLTACGSPEVGGLDVAAPATSLASSTAASPAPTQEAPRHGLAPDGYDGRYRVVALVVDCPDQPVGLVMGAIAAVGGPPPCGDTLVHGWDWGAVPQGSITEEGGVRFGTFVVVGTYDGAAVTLTEPPGLPAPGQGWGIPETSDLDRCPEPPGGWQGSEPDLAAQQTRLQAAVEAARSVEGFAGEGFDPRHETVGGRVVDDPSRAVLVIATTGDVARTEAVVGPVWRGNLCVLPAPRPPEELRGVHEDLGMPVGTLGSYVDEVRGVVVLEVEHATQAAQDAYDDRYGTGVVELRGALVPVDRPPSRRR